MPRYYCDYCDTYLTHDSPSVRKQHNAGYKHKANVRSYYQQFEEQQTQSLIDQRIKEHLGQAAAFQVGAQFNQHLLSLPGSIPRPRLPILPVPMIPGMRPPILPTPTSGAPGFPGGVPSMAPGSMPPGSVPPGSVPPGSMPPGSMPPGSVPPGSMPPGSVPPGSVPPGSMPPGATSMPMQMNSLPRPPILPPPVSGTGVAPVPALNPVMYHPAPQPGSAVPAGSQGAAPSTS